MKMETTATTARMVQLLVLLCSTWDLSNGFSVLPRQIITPMSSAQSQTIKTQRPARSSSSRSILFATPETKQGGEDLADQPKSNEEPLLSELDARVLKSMLQDSKLDLDTEENMVKLLARGIAPKKASAPPPLTKEEEEQDGQYSSAVFKTLSDTKLWKALQKKGADIFESMQIYVSNRIERDSKLLASVGVFAWERAVRDVARALPASGTSSAAVGRAMRRAVRQLGNSSSYEAMNAEASVKKLQDLDNLYEELNTPMDEIKSVMQSIRDILSGDTVSSSSSSRGLRSVAPAGQSQNKERQRRAYKRRKESVLRQEKEILNLGRAAGAAVDVAFEMKREFQVESSKPGYRSEGARNAIAAGAAQTAQLLDSAKRDGWRRALFGSSDVKDSIRELVGSDNMETVKEVADTQAISQLLEEQSRVIERLELCIDNPGETWLTPDVLKNSDVAINEQALQDVVTAMICARDDLEAEDGNDSILTVPEVLSKMRQVKSSVDMITSLAATCAGYDAANRLSSILYGSENDEQDRPSLLALDDVEASIDAAIKAAEAIPETDDGGAQEVSSPFFYAAPKKVERDPNSNFGASFADDVDLASEYRSGQNKKPDKDPNPSFESLNQKFSDAGDDVMRVVFAEVMTESKKPQPTNDSRRNMGKQQDIVFTEFDKVAFTGDLRYVDIDDDSNVSVATVEVVGEDDFDDAMGNAKSVSSVSDSVDGQTQEKENLVVAILLRSLDVVLFVAEKVLLVGIPRIVSVAGTASTRLTEINRNGLGYPGWKRLENAKTGAKRY